MFTRLFTSISSSSGHDCIIQTSHLVGKLGRALQFTAPIPAEIQDETHDSEPCRRAVMYTECTGMIEAVGRSEDRRSRGRIAPDGQSAKEQPFSIVSLKPELGTCPTQVCARPLSELA